MGETFDKELVKKQYPYPIATYYAKMQKEEMFVNVNIKMTKKWKIKMYIFQDLLLSL